MKRIGNADIKIKLSEFRGLTDLFRIHFYTTNREIYISKTNDDVDDEYIRLNWDELVSIGQGVLNYTLYTYQTDDDFDDDVYDNEYSRTTFYYIETDVIIPDEDPTKSIQELLQELDDKIDDEIERSTNRDDLMDDKIDDEIERSTNKDNQTDETIESNERVVAEALNDLNKRKADKSDLARVATTGDYNDLINTPTIPTVPTNVSAFTNDAGYLNGTNAYTKTEINTIIEEDERVIAESLNDLNQRKVDITDLATVATSGSYNDLSNKPTIPTVPTNVSAFNNDANYATQTWVGQQGFLTAQDITGKADKTDISSLERIISEALNDLNKRLLKIERK